MYSHRKLYEGMKATTYTSDILTGHRFILKTVLCVV